jgi:hypothetical protein
MTDQAHNEVLGVGARLIQRLQKSLAAFFGGSVVLFALGAAIQWLLEGADGVAWDKVTGGTFLPALLAIGVWLLILVVWHLWRAPADVLKAYEARAGDAEARVAALEAERARTAIPGEHRRQLRELLSRAVNAIESDRQIDYGDPLLGDQTRRHIFAAHFYVPAGELRYWDESLWRCGKADGELGLRMLREASKRGLCDAPYHELLVTALSSSTCAKARAGALGTEANLEWRGFDGSLEVVGLGRFGTLPLREGESIAEYRERADAVTAPVDQLFEDAQAWDEAKAVGTTYNEHAQLAKQSIIDNLHKHQMAESIWVSDDCPVCSLNIGGAVSNLDGT